MVTIACVFQKPQSNIAYEKHMLSFMKRVYCTRRAISAMLDAWCDRAASLLAHWHLMFKDHPTHPFARVRTLDHLSQFLQRDWAAVTETPRPVAGQLGFHYIVGWPQSWYVGQCTCVLCYERLDAELNGFCDRSAGNASAAEAATAASSSDHTRQVNVSSPACVAIRRLYAEDTAIHERHCRRVQSVR